MASEITNTVGTGRPDLALAFEEFDAAADRQGFIGYQVLRPYEVQQQSGQFSLMPLEELLQEPNTDRTNSGAYNRIYQRFNKLTYSTDEQGLEGPVDERERNMFADWLDHELAVTELLRDAVLRAAEKRVADAIFDATTWTGAALTTAITNEWDDHANATPIDDVEGAITKVWENSGLNANAVIMNRNVFRNLRRCTQMVNRIESSGAGESSLPGRITVAQIAQAFDVDYVLVAGGTRNTANRGQAASLARIWSDEYVMVGRIGTTDNPKEPCLGRVFWWGGDGGVIAGTVETYEEAQSRAEIVRVRHDVDEKILLVEAGHLLSNATT